MGEVETKPYESICERAFREIDEAIEKKDWFLGFANSVTYLEHLGYWLLRWYCIKEKIDISDKLKNLRVSTIALILYLLKLIDMNTFTKINTIVRERNKLIHPTQVGLSYRDRKEKERATELLKDAKLCITKLKERIGH
jgi:hypothetical protein